MAAATESPTALVSAGPKEVASPRPPAAPEAAAEAKVEALVDARSSPWRALLPGEARGGGELRACDPDGAAASGDDLEEQLLRATRAPAPRCAGRQ
jgi:hypothetical protein